MYKQKIMKMFVIYGYTNKCVKVIFFLFQVRRFKSLDRMTDISKL